MVMVGSGDGDGGQGMVMVDGRGGEADSGVSDGGQWC